MGEEMHNRKDVCELSLPRSSGLLERLAPRQVGEAVSPA